MKKVLDTILRVELADEIALLKLQKQITKNKSTRAKKSTTPVPPAPEPIEPEPTDLTMSPEEQEEWANALVMMTVGE